MIAAEMDWVTGRLRETTLLCERAAWLVPNAMAMVRFIGHKLQDPRKQLGVLLCADKSGEQLDTLLGVTECK